ncbi:MAG: polynucleotide adenylyltransferase PcnB [Burkholderiaceae bacterium]|jgi:poly(A) polymerase|nr:polynucleotide adenylyltransferase PcnB [Burkholderiaceae bacterium]
MFKGLFNIIRGKKGRTPAGRKATVLGPSHHGINPKLLSANADRVVATLQKAGFDAFVVGGAVRDLLLGVKPKDFDVATNAEPEQIKRLFRRAFIIGRRFQIVHVLFGQDLIEVTTFRAPGDDERVRDSAGRLLRDNTFGTQEEDAVRRDFTINAMYYDPQTQTLHDYHGGIRDLQNRILRVIGDPMERFREDPVRMLRVVRFSAKLGFGIDADTRKPMVPLSSLINNVPGARLFDEVIKLLTSGYAMKCLSVLREQGLHRNLFPFLDEALARADVSRFIELSLQRTDARIHAGKTASPGFLFATLLWHPFQERWQHHRENGEHLVPALHLAADDIFSDQAEKLALQRRITSDIRDIWSLQPRLEKRAGRTVYKLLENERFRAAYDFLLLRCEAGEIPAETGDWWTTFINADNPERESLLADRQRSAPSSSRRRRRSGQRQQKSAEA